MTNHSCFRVVLFVVSLFFVSGAMAAKIDFTDYAGAYRGSWLITAGTESFGTAVNVDVIVPKNGRKMTLDMSGILVAGMQSVGIFMTQRFYSKRKLKSTSPLMGFAGPVATRPTRFKGRNGKFRATITASPGANLVGSDISGTTVTYKYKFTRKKLTITGTGTLITFGTPTPLSLFISVRNHGN